MNAQSFAALMGGLLSATGHKLNTAGVETWRRFLSDIPDDVLTAAMHRAICECKAFPSVALIREFAAEAQHGITSTTPDVWPSVLKAVRYFGIYGKAQAREKIPPIVWKAIGGDVGWEWLCDMTEGQRNTFAAQFRDRYRELKASEDRDRRLPEKLRPAINNTPIVALPEAAKEVKALPAPAQPTAEEVERAKLKVFREPPPAKEELSTEETERRRASQIAALKRMTGT